MTATVTAAPTADRPAPEGGADRARGRVHATSPATRLGVLVVAYLAASFGIWWSVWSGHPTTTYLCGCGDPGQYLWFFAAPAQALLHGHSPFFSGADYHPGGVNMLDNPGVLGLAIVAAPLTWTLGPVAAVNTVLLVTPVLSSLAGYVLLRRWVRWWPAAAIGGGFYGFSPAVVSSLAYVHLQVAFLALPPLIFLCLDELLVRQQRRPVPVGVGLGVLVAVQYLVSPEMLVLTALVAAVGVVVLVLWAARRAPDALRGHLPDATRGIGAGVGTALLLAGYPVWFALAGPRHTVGAPWSFIAETGNAVKELFLPGAAANRPALAPTVFGYFGDPGPALDYLGITVVIALVVTVVALRRTPVIRLAAVVTVVVAVLSLGSVLVTTPPTVTFQATHRLHPTWLLPWTVLAHVPLVDEASPSRLSAPMDLVVALIGAIGLDRLVDVLRGRLAATEGPATPRSAATLRRAAPAFGALAVAAAVLTPVGLAYHLPLDTTTVTTPRWFRTAADHLPTGSVVLALPWGLSQTSVWQAVSGMHIVMAGGDAFVPGPNGHVVDEPRRGTTDAVLTDLSTYAVKPEPTPAVERTVRRSLVRWGVTDVVVTPETYGAAYDVGFLTAVLGTPPSVQDGSWVWSNVRHTPPPLAEPPDAVVDCQSITPSATAMAHCMVLLSASSP
jgi:hypothetical protein